MCALVPALKSSDEQGRLSLGDQILLRRLRSLRSSPGLDQMLPHAHLVDTKG